MMGMVEHVNQLPIEKRAQILSCLVEGVSIRGTSRLCDVAVNTVVKLQIEAGEACAAYQDRVMRGLTCKRLQCDEVWSFCGAKQKNATAEQMAKGWGDIWTWTAIDSETKLIPCWYVGNRDGEAAYHFIHDLASRLAHRVQLTTDGHSPYLAAVEDAFGAEIDYAQLVKIYGDGPRTDARYSPAVCTGARKDVIAGSPAAQNISTSHVERSNLSFRMGMRRFTRLTNAFSKKAENHAHAVAVFTMFYNFCRIHTTLRCTPAMEAGIADRVWSMKDVVALMDEQAEKAA